MRLIGPPPEAPRRAVGEYLAVLDDAAFGAATPVVPKFIAPADPASRWTAADGGLAYFAYKTNFLVDLDHAIIVDVEPTTAIRQAEVTAAKRMIERARERFDLYPARLAADAGYGSAAMLGWRSLQEAPLGGAEGSCRRRFVYEQGIEPDVSVFDKSGRQDGTFARDAFTYDREGDVYVCPAEKMLTTKSTLVNDGATLLYRASTFDCGPCDLKLAHLKRILKLDRLRPRGPCVARDEFHLAAAAQNLRKMAKLIPMPDPQPA